ncbi:hypothetical protein Patl1_10100 [Pistacia atlantica]|uniref:Uncharacterized protein n=1 Tax=Pistacia atlantica TaxID=434234 RepID=A0ACC1A3Y3_9ROSI|nr:hypothetical protein Patl1_10100 [Pistacia atlantica]
MISAIAPPAITIAGRHESRTSERSHPLTKAIMYPPTKVVCRRTRCLVLISFFKYKPRILAACLSPVTIQHDTSGIHKTQNLNKFITRYKLS